MTTLALPLAAQLNASPQTETTVGNYFVANYPPFGYWRPEQVPSFHNTLEWPPRPGVDLGIYVHIPFCRKRCHFCYFRVYTDKNASDIRQYLRSVTDELRMYARRSFVRDRTPRFIYFGGGTPSYLTAEQLRYLTDEMKKILPWDQAEEVTLEAEPGTINDGKLRAIRDLGVTRLSLGIEHFDDHILEVNGRAHCSLEIHRAYAAARAIGFRQINIDLIAGMLEETEAKWQETVAKTLELQPDSLTIYQMEVPYNTSIYQKMKAEGTLLAPVADWETKRRWVDDAFRVFEKAGYSISSATTVTKQKQQRFLYRKGLFDGADILSVGVSSFGHLGGINYQNLHDMQPYLNSIRDGKLPTYRAYALTPEENYIREFALQLKGGSVSASAFAARFGIDPRQQFSAALQTLEQRGFLIRHEDRIELTRPGLLRVDRLLFDFFRPEHRNGRFA